MLAHSVGFAAVRGSRPLDARDFLRWSHCMSLYLELQSKAGRERLKTRVASRLATDYEAALAETEYDDDADADAGILDGAQGVEGSVALGRTTAIRQQLGAAAHAVLDGTRVGDSVFKDPDKLLRLLPPDDPRAIYVRAGGRLDAWGDPITKEHREASGHGPHRTRANAPLPTPGVPGVPLPASWETAPREGDAAPPVAGAEPPDTANPAEQVIGRAIAERQGRGFAAPDDLSAYLT